jgi:hypothetical protein
MSPFFTSDLRTSHTNVSHFSLNASPQHREIHVASAVFTVHTSRSFATFCS